jgi:enoyl-CoA hydratase/carnithine racemase
LSQVGVSEVTAVGQDLTRVRYTVDDAAATTRMHRPARKNAMTMQMVRDLVAAFDLSDADDSVRAVIVTGGDQIFCAGASLKSVIGALSGAAVGIGATLTLPMDIRVAGEGTRFGFVFTRRGLVPEAASSWLLPKIVGISRAMEWVTTGRMVTAGEAASAGLVNHVVPDAAAGDRAREIAREIAENSSPLAVATVRHPLRGMLEEPSPWSAHRADSRAIYELAAGDDLREGAQAFFERRPPRFTSSVTQDFPDYYITRWPHRPEEMS